VLQPAEFAKLTSVLYLAGVFANRKAWPKKIKPRKNFAQWADTVAVPKMLRAAPIVWVLLAALLIEAEPDLGTAAVVGFTAFLMMFVGGVTRKSLVVAVLLCVLGLTAVVVKEPYRLERITQHSDRWSQDNVDDTDFQTDQAETAMASGGAFGAGLGNGRAKHVLPATTTDFIMATVAEETGLFGSYILLAVLAALVLRLLRQAALTHDPFARMVLTGVAGWIGIQTCVNMMMANGFLPAIGIPLPFISSGGSSLIALWFALGLCQSVLAPKPLTVEEGHALTDHGWRDRRAHLSRA
jgi:cell division protein FtsW